MNTADANHFERLIGFLKEKRENITFHDIITLAEVAAQSMQGFFKAMDAKVYRELREIAGYIESMRTEIGALQVNDLKESRIPSAGQELGAIVAATEAATDTIMTCAEAVMAADANDQAAYKALVDEKMMVIFEACSFQDITGQRVAKVIETLKHIEARVTRFSDALRARDTGRTRASYFGNDACCRGGRTRSEKGNGAYLPGTVKRRGSRGAARTLGRFLAPAD